MVDFIRHARRLGLLVLGLVGTAPAWSSDYSTGGAFLNLGHGARAHGLGGAAVSLIRDDAAVYWNPANLAFLPSYLNATFMHADILPGIDDGYNTVSLARSQGPRLGETTQRLRPTRWGYGIFFSSMSFQFDSGAGWSENVLQLGAGYALTNFSSLGLAVKLLRLSNDFDNGDATGVGFDVGLTALVLEDLIVGVAARDVITRVSWDTETRQSVQSQLTVGLEYRPWRQLGIEVDSAWRDRSFQRIALAAEYLPYEGIFAVRGGLTRVSAGESRLYPSLGLGVELGRFIIDYGVSFDDKEAFDLGHRFSLSAGF